MKRKVLIYGALGAALTAGAVALFLFFFERVEEQVDVPPGRAARANAFLAAERLLNALGLPATSVSGPIRRPPADHVVVLAAPRRTFGPDRARWLLEWVEEGGHLILAPKAPEDEDEDEDRDSKNDAKAPKEDRDLLLEALGVTVDRTPQGEAAVLGLHAARGAPARAVSVAPSPRLAAAQEPQFADGPGGGAVMRFRRGEGWVTVLADAAFLTNEHIGEHEHASFLWSLVTTPSRPAGVWLVYRDQLPGLRQLVAERAWAALVSAVLALAAWLWSRAARFGPPLAPPPAGRRSLREHLEATAEFLWRRGQAETLVASERQAVLHAVRRQHPAWAALPENERMRYLAELSRVGGAALVLALEGPVDDDPDSLLRTVATLEDVRRSL